MAPKKGLKMGIGEFLAEGGGVSSWADEMDDVASVGRDGGSNPSNGGYGGASGGGDRYGDRYGDRHGNDRHGNDRYGGYSRADDSDRPPRALVPVPDKAPFTAHIGNLSFDVTEEQIIDFFSGHETTSVRVVRDREDRPKGFGYVEFKSKEALLAALDMNGTQLAGRTARVNVAEPPKERPDDRTTGDWRRTGPLPSLDQPRRGYERQGDREDSGRRQASSTERDSKIRDLGNWERKGPLAPLAPSPTSDRARVDRRRSPAPSADGDRGDRGDRPHLPRERPAVERQPSAAERDNEWRRGARPDTPLQSTPTSPVLPHVRPKLELKKRSEQPIETVTPTSSDKPNPFGGARPIDTTQREKEIEERRLAAAAEKRAREEKAKDEKTAREADDKPSESSPTPGPTKHMGMGRRGSGPTNDGPAAGGTPAAHTDERREKTLDRRRPAQQPGRGDTWRSNRAKEQPKNQAKQDAENDGWSTVASKRGGRGAGKSVVSAQ